MIREVWHVTDELLASIAGMEASRSALGAQLDALRNGLVRSRKDVPGPWAAEVRHARHALLVRLWERLTASEQNALAAMAIPIGVEDYERVVWRSDLREERVPGQLAHYRTIAGEVEDVGYLVVEQRNADGRMLGTRTVRSLELHTGRENLLSDEIVNEDRAVVRGTRPQRPSLRDAAERIGVGVYTLRRLRSSAHAKIAGSEEFRILKGTE